MIPVLYPENETEFANNGLGRLGDAIRCTVLEERNGKYELEMVYPIAGKRFPEIKHSRYIYALPSDAAQPQPFQIYYISKPLDGKVTIRAEHISYRLSHIPVPPLTASSCAEALNKLKTNAAEACPFEFWTDKSTVANFTVSQPSSIRSLLGGQRGSILDVYGGEYEFDKFTVKLHSQRGTDRGVTLRYGKNITDIRQEENIQNTITGVYPFWRGADALGSAEVTELDEKVLHSANATNFPYQRTVPLDLSQDFGETPPTKTELRNRALAYMTANNAGVPSVSIKVSFAPLWQTEEYKTAANLERVRLCDTVTVEFPALEVSATAKVVRTKYDVLAERYDEVELGDVRANLGAAIRNALSEAVEISTEDIRNAKSELRKAIKHATDLITGGLGGYVVFGRNADGEPEEILIMDKPDVATAVNVIRLNKNGIGFSTNGYGGPFANAWTIDGKLVADFITTGTLTAVLIKAGILSDVAGKNYWNMETGEFRLASTATVGGKTVQEVADDAVDDYDDALTQQKIFNRLTNNGAAQGITMTNGSLYINASYINTGSLSASRISGGTLTLGGNNNTNGTLVVKNASGTTVGSWNKDGISVKSGSITGGTINGATITVGGSNNESGLIKVKNASGTQVGKWDKDGIELNKGKLSSSDEKVYVDLTNGEISCTRLVGKKGNVYYGLEIGKNGDVMQLSGGASGGPLRFDHDSGLWKVCSGDSTRFGSYFGSSFYGVYAVCNSSAMLVAGSYDVYVSDTGYLKADGMNYAYLPSYSYAGGNRIATTSSSAKRYKHGIKEIENEELDPRRLLLLKVVQFEWNDDHSLQYEDMRGKTIPGIIAEDVDEIYPAAVIHDQETGEIESWDERRIIPGMLALIQEQEKRIKDLESRLAKLEGAMNV